MNHPFWGPGYTHLWETLCIFWLVIWSPVPQGWMFTPLRWFQGPKGHAEVMISWGTCPMWCRVLLIPGCHGRKMLRSISRNQDFLGSICSLKIGIFHFWIWQQKPFLLPMAPWWSGGFKDVLLHKKVKSTKRSFQVGLRMVASSGARRPCHWISMGESRQSTGKNHTAIFFPSNLRVSCKNGPLNIKSSDYRICFWSMFLLDLPACLTVGGATWAVESS